MATRLQFENSNEVGVFARLTNRYAILLPASTLYSREFHDLICVCPGGKRKTSPSSLAVWQLLPDG
eukprot:1308-Eustigmatos_ZCMA.PRE.1